MGGASPSPHSSSGSPFSTGRREDGGSFQIPMAQAGTAGGGYNSSVAPTISWPGRSHCQLPQIQLGASPLSSFPHLQRCWAGRGRGSKQNPAVPRARGQWLTLSTSQSSWWLRSSAAPFSPARVGESASAFSEHLLCAKHCSRNGIYQ